MKELPGLTAIGHSQKVGIYRVPGLHGVPDGAQRYPRELGVAIDRHRDPQVVVELEQRRIVQRHRFAEQHAEAPTVQSDIEVLLIPDDLRVIRPGIEEELEVHGAGQRLVGKIHQGSLHRHIARPPAGNGILCPKSHHCKKDEQRRHRRHPRQSSESNRSHLFLPVIDSQCAAPTSPTSAGIRPPTTGPLKPES